MISGRPHGPDRRPAIAQPFLASEPQTSDIVPHSRHALVRGFGELWETRRGNRPMPLRDDFRVEQLVPWFGHVLIMEAVDAGRDFRYRMIGTAITEFLDRDYSGKLVSECDYGAGDDARDRVLDAFRRPIVDGRPVFRSGHVVWATDKTWRTYDSVHCPVSRDGAAAELTMGVLYFGSVAVPSPRGTAYPD